MNSEDHLTAYAEELAYGTQAPKEKSEKAISLFCELEKVLKEL